MRADSLTRWIALGAALVWSWVRLRARPARTGAVAPPERLRAAGLLSAALLLLAPLDMVRAQDEPGPRVVIPGPAVRSYAEYDPSGRRDPFEPMYSERAAVEETGPRFDSLTLTGVFLGSGANSLAVLEDLTHRGYFVRLGQQIGNARLVEILPQAAVFEVTEYGASRRVVLRLERTEESR